MYYFNEGSNVKVTHLRDGCLCLIEGSRQTEPSQQPTHPSQIGKLPFVLLAFSANLLSSSHGRLREWTSRFWKNGLRVRICLLLLFAFHFHFLQIFALVRVFVTDCFISLLGFAFSLCRCKHYRRRCQIRAPCCNEIYPCRHCHNEATVFVTLAKTAFQFINS